MRNSPPSRAQSTTKELGRFPSRLEAPLVVRGAEVWISCRIIESMEEALTSGQRCDILGMTWGRALMQGKVRGFPVRFLSPCSQ